VRAVLFVEDLVRAFLSAEENAAALAGRAFNMGGGPGQTVSLLELLSLIEELHDRRPQVFFEDWRTGDQRYYVSDTRRFTAATGWSPLVSVREGGGQALQLAPRIAGGGGRRRSAPGELKIHALACRRWAHRRSAS